MSPLFFGFLQLRRCVSQSKQVFQGMLKCIEKLKDISSRINTVIEINEDAYESVSCVLCFYISGRNT